MTLWQITGLVAHACLLGVGSVLLWRGVPQLRKGCRDRKLARNLLLVRLAVLGLLAAAVTEIHFIATELWQIAVTVVLTAVGLVLIRRVYRKALTPAKHRAPWMDGLRLTDGRPRKLGSHSHRSGSIPPVQ